MPTPTRPADVPPDYDHLILDWGAVRLNVPKSWPMQREKNAFVFYDGAPPADNSRLVVSYVQLDPAILPPLTAMLETFIAEDPRTPEAQSALAMVARPQGEVVWAELRFTDAGTRQTAFSRLALTRRADVQAFITLDFWAGDVARCEPVWAEVLRSLTLGDYVPR